MIPQSSTILTTTAELPLGKRPLSAGCWNPLTMNPLFFCEAPASTSPRKRRRVRFHSKDDEVVCPEIRHVESFSNLPQDHKNELWLQNEDLESSMNAIRKTFHRQDSDTDKVPPVYGQALFATYLACCNDSPDSDDLPVTLSAEQLEKLSTERGHCARTYLRGLESCALPELAAKRSKQRKDNIANVVAIDQRVRLLGIPEGPELVQQVAEQLSRPSRKFAQAMGIGDSLAALREYRTADTTVSRAA